ncbi:MAG TPA: NAD(P)H-binding protein [Solirubrobacteraceae bacterium]|jgi:uncharacterized protein YbjT (DUF2867 family)|nr:NAD(P)H-binding protein [Solirubrobacteraceae bacterium]
MSAPIAIVGAAGPTGLTAIRALRTRGRAVRALVHRDEHADAVRAVGAAEVTTIELDDPGTLAPAFAGAGAVLHIPPVFSAREPEQVQASVDAAAAAGIDRFVQHSVMHPFTPGVRHHLRKSSAEAIVRRSGLRWTILEPCMYASTIMLYWARSPGGMVILPYSLDTFFTPVALADVAEATALVFSQDGHEFATYELGGPETLSGREMLAQVCRALGEDRDVRSGELSELAMPASWDESARADMAAMCEHYDHVGLSGGGRVLEMLLGRPATRFADTLVPSS